MTHSRMLTLLLLPQVLLAFACAREPARRMLAPSEDAAAPLVALAEEGPHFTEWSAPVNLGPVVNSDVEELTPAISKDGLSLYFGSPRPATGMGGDLWVSRRASADAPWEAPRNLGAIINTPPPVADNGAMLSRDGHLLYFQSNRPGGFGNMDLYVSRRKDKDDDLSWGTPVNLGSTINTDANEAGLTFFEDENGVRHFYFQSNRPGGPGGNDIYTTTQLSDGTFSPPVLVVELSSPADDQRAAVRHDGLEIYLASTRAGTLGGMDIWVATRSSVTEPWSTPVNASSFNTVNFEAAPALSSDGTELYFHAAVRPENVGGPRFDIWVASRKRVTGAAGR